jgi:hypothetical protein
MRSSALVCSATDYPVLMDTAGGGAGDTACHGDSVGPGRVFGSLLRACTSVACHQNDLSCELQHQTLHACT